MKTEKFLHFWTNHNDTIIEVLVAVVLLMVIYLAFRYYFGPETSEGKATAGAIDTKEIEKTLQKILETQSKIPATVSSAVPVASSAEAPAAAATFTGVVPEELEKLKVELAEKERLLTQAKDEAAKATALAAASANTALGAAAAIPGAASDDLQKLETKIRDLEARLAEYEIISEDIADLSFFKEENTRLQNELAAVKGGAAPPAPMAVAPPPEVPPVAVVAPTPVEPLPEAPAVAAAPPAPPAPSEATMVAGSVDVAVTDATTVAAAVTGDPAAASIDMTPAAPMAATNLMVQGGAPQQAPGAAGAAEVPPVPPADSRDSAELMDQFEKFVKKG